MADESSELGVRMVTLLAFAGVAVGILTMPNYGAPNKGAFHAYIHLVNDYGSNSTTQTTPLPDRGAAKAPVGAEDSKGSNSDPPLHFRTAPTPPTPPNAESNAPALDPDAQRELVNRMKGCCARPKD